MIKPEKGRSFVELIATLAIMGILSCLGMAAITSAKKHKIANNILADAHLMNVEVRAKNSGVLNYMPFEPESDYIMTAKQIGANVYVTVPDVPYAICSVLLQKIVFPLDHLEIEQEPINECTIDSTIDFVYGDAPNTRTEEIPNQVEDGCGANLHAPNGTCVCKDGFVLNDDNIACEKKPEKYCGARDSEVWMSGVQKAQKECENEGSNKYCAFTANSGKSPNGGTCITLSSSNKYYVGKDGNDRDKGTKYGGKQFFISYNSMNWFAAASWCLANNARMATYSDLEYEKGCSLNKNNLIGNSCTPEQKAILDGSNIWVWLNEGSGSTAYSFYPRYGGINKKSRENEHHALCVE